MILDDPARLARLDAHDVRSILAAFPEHCRAAAALRAQPALTVRRPRVVIVAGMGGSAAGGDCLAACAADQVEVPVLVHRGYGLPGVARGDALVIAASYSGETEEVVSAAETALERGLPLVVMTTGGRLAALASARGCPLVTLPGGLMPRMALAYLFLPALTLLADAGVPVATASEITETIGVVSELASALAPARPASANEAKRLALAIGDRMPALYGGPLTAAVAYRWKTDFAENAKTLALAGSVPEMNHNEIEAWHGHAACDLYAVLLRDPEESPAIARRFALLGEMMGPVAGGVGECWARGKARAARLLGLAYVGQWTSYYLAIVRGIDPWAVPIIEDFKRRMNAP
ncbi:MAG TPA: bifunctional phosphoglucose/phosphomannose isomerase [Methylomirabilota bacterium]